MQGFISNLRDFFLERPIKIRGDIKNPFQPTTFGASVSDNLKEWFHPLPASAKGPDKSGMLVAWTPEFGSFWSNFRSAFSKSKLPKGARRGS